MRNIELYIEGIAADIAQDGSVFLTARVDDISNPAIIENPYTQQVTLPPTSKNKSIFGFIDRPDHRTTSAAGGTGVNFNAAKRLNFRLEINGNICQCGYLKLDHVDARGFYVTLYGGLGALLYDLSFDENGDALSLASLDYGYNLAHNINAATIAQAWAAAGDIVDSGDYDDGGKWGVINYAPTYDGIPQNFDANKQLINPGEVMQAESASDDGASYAPRSGASVVTYGKAYDGWDTKEFRAYLMRPVISTRAIIAGIISYAATKGYALSLNTVYLPDSALRDAWLTLPRLDEKNEDQETTTASVSIAAFNADAEGGASVAVSIPAGASDYVRHHITTQLKRVTIASSQSSLYLHGKPDNPNYEEVRAFVVRAIATNANDEIVGSSGAYVITDSWQTGHPRINIEELLRFNGIETGVDYVRVTRLSRAASNSYYFYDFQDVPFNIDFYASGATKIQIRGDWVSAALVNDTFVESFGNPNEAFNVEGNTPYTISRVAFGASSDDMQITSGTIRTGALITQSKLLGGTDTPARYLVGLLRLCGMYLAPTAPDGKTFEIQDRAMFHTGLQEYYNLEDHIDHARGVDLKPIAYDKRYYLFKYSAGAGAWLSYYRDKYGLDYGEKRVNTGYGFNNESADALNGLVFTNCADVLEQRDTFNLVTWNGRAIPSPMLAGGKYSLYRADGESKQFDIATPPASAAITYFNTLSGYDFSGAQKAQFHDGENRPTGQRNALLYLAGISYDYTARGFRISDDSAVMVALNNGVPCWDARSNAAAQIVGGVPLFQRSYGVESLEISTPQEYGDPIPRADTYDLYTRCWSDYIADKYGADSKILTAYVDLGTMPVPQDALRRFYRYAGNDWALVEMSDYDLTGGQRFTKCVFVRVTDWVNYGLITG